MKWILNIAFLICLVSNLEGARLNTAAPSFVLMNQTHQSRSLGTYHKKVVFINFWASWCAPCQQELPELARLASDYRGKKAQIVAINVDENPANAEKILHRLGLDSTAMDILFDTATNVASAYNIPSMPSSFIIDRQGIIRFKHNGFHTQDPQRWRQEIDSLLFPSNRPAIVR